MSIKISVSRSTKQATNSGKMEERKSGVIAALRFVYFGVLPVMGLGLLGYLAFVYGEQATRALYTQGLIIVKKTMYGLAGIGGCLFLFLQKRKKSLLGLGIPGGAALLDGADHYDLLFFALLITLLALTVFGAVSLLREV